jgi:biotin carboxylase
VLAEVCARRGIKFIGPSAKVITQMGDKIQARLAMIKAGIPVIPGSDHNLETPKKRSNWPKNRLPGHAESHQRRRRTRHSAL